MKFADFILAHDGDDLGRLALSRSRIAAELSDFDLALTTLEVRRKLRDKVPEWYAVPSLRYPLRLSGEQCSSATTARYKASLVRGERIADLTGGLGVDSWAFAQVYGEVLYNEMRPELADAAEANFRELGLTNVRVRNCELVPGSLAEVLNGFRPDVLFLDPARRAADGRKVFRLEDSQPDVLQLLPELLESCPDVLLKLSPMADIALVCRQLGCVKEVHVVAADGECKELLLLLEKDWSGPHSTTIVEDTAVMEIPTLIPASEPESPADCFLDGFLFEPGKAMLKAGAFGFPCRYGLAKLGQHTHLYTGAEIPAALKPFGKSFRILESAPLDKRGIKSIGQKYSRADVTARNIPLTSDHLRKKLGVADGGSVHIFGLHVDALRSNLLLAVERD